MGVGVIPWSHATMRKARAVDINSKKQDLSSLFGKVEEIMVMLLSHTARPCQVRLQRVGVCERDCLPHVTLVEQSSLRW